MNKFFALGVAASVLVPVAFVAFVVATTPQGTTPEPRGEASAFDYCPALESELSRLVLSTHQEDEEQIRSSVVEVRTITRRAKSDGVAIDHPSSQWLLELDRSSELFLYLLNNGRAEFTDEELAKYLDRIIFWFEHGLAVCTGQPT
ncbi:hypothetical protein OAR17_02175 [Pontimonas sp.]|nr:hypothetical protein [Pontimonas sp.]